MGIAVPSQLWKAEHQQIMALIGYSGLGLAGYSWAGLGGWAAPLAIHRDGPFLCATERTGSTAFARRRGPLILKPMPTTAMEAMTDTVSATGATAMEVLATGTASGRLTPTLTTAMVDTALPSWASPLPV